MRAHERLAGLCGHHWADGAPKATNRIVRAGNISAKRTVPGPILLKGYGILVAQRNTPISHCLEFVENLISL